MTFLGWLQLILVVFAVGALLGVGVTAVSCESWLRRLEDVAPRPRFLLLVAIGILPAVLGATALGVSFAPSFLDALGLVADHCAHHGGHAFHLCFIHGEPPPVSPLILGCGVVVFLWLMAGWSEEISRIRKMETWRTELDDLARQDNQNGVRIVETDRPLAVAIGLFRPTVWVSDRMRDLLNPGQFDAVLAHEQAHVRWYDSLVKFAVRLAAQFHTPAVRDRLFEELDLACEQACDEEAAAAVGDRLTVAEAILSVERASETAELPPSALGFGGRSLERRVRGIVDGQWQRPRWAFLSAAAVTVIAGLVTSYDVLHHLAESLLLQLF